MPYILILPPWLPDMMNLSSGENATVQISTGPTSMLPIFSPEIKSHSRRQESNELEAHAVKYKYIYLVNGRIFLKDMEGNE